MDFSAPLQALGSDKISQLISWPVSVVCTCLKKVIPHSARSVVCNPWEEVERPSQFWGLDKGLQAQDKHPWLGFTVVWVPVLFNGSGQISLVLGFKSSFKRWCSPGKCMMEQCLESPSMVSPGLGVCPLLAGQDGRQCLSLARRKRKEKLDFYTAAIEREDGFQSCSQSVGRDRRTKHSCEELAASSAAVLSPKGECPHGIGSPRNYFLSSLKIWHRHITSPAL